MKILVACEESQAVTIELRKLGHEAIHATLNLVAVDTRNGTYSRT